MTRIIVILNNCINKYLNNENKLYAETKAAQTLTCFGMNVLQINIFFKYSRLHVPRILLKTVLRQIPTN